LAQRLLKHPPMMNLPAFALPASTGAPIASTIVTVSLPFLSVAVGVTVLVGVLGVAAGLARTVRRLQTRRASRNRPQPVGPFASAEGMP
jgi:hypothetical protein